MTLKRSRQRELIQEFLMTRHDHPTADVVYRNVRIQDPHISLGTVYRNLTLLARIGAIRRLQVGDGADHFDADLSPHDHFVCTECGKVLDLRTEPGLKTPLDQGNDSNNHLGQTDNHLEQIAPLTDTDPAFDGRITGRITYYYGVCGSCLRAKAVSPQQ